MFRISLTFLERACIVYGEQRAHQRSDENVNFFKAVIREDEVLLYVNNFA